MMDLDWEAAGDGRRNINGQRRASNNLQGHRSNHVRNASNENDNNQLDYIRFHADDENALDYYASRNDSARSENPNEWILAEAINEFFTCPICKDPYIESTSTNCGHKFCKRCLKKWLKEKPACPVCSTLITYTHRLYSDDQMIESQLEKLSPDVKERFVFARKKRINALVSKGNSRSIVEKVLRKWDNSMIYLRCKNRAEIRNGLVSTIKGTWNCLTGLSQDFNFGIVFGIILGVMMINLANYGMNFAMYAWLAIQNYNGTIPETWINPISEQAKVESDDTVIEWLILKALWLY